MRLEYLPLADADLDGSSLTTARQRRKSSLRSSRIERALDRICEFPNAYPRQPDRPYRVHVTRKYRLRIVYLVVEDWVEVIGVFRFRNGQS